MDNIKSTNNVMLSDSKIVKEIEKGNILIRPFDPTALSSNSYDLHLSKYIAIYKDSVLDMKKDNKITMLTIPEEGMLLLPNNLYLGATTEFTSSRKYVPVIEGKSSIGRLGLEVHRTAGFGDVGFEGYWTLEISVLKPLIVYPGVPIAQIAYHKVEGKVINSYDTKGTSKYKNQGNKPVRSMMFKNFINESR